MVRTCTGPVQWPDSERLSFKDSVCVVSIHRQAGERTYSSLPSPPPSCAWKPPEMNGPYWDLMRPFACVRFPCEFIPLLRRVNARDEPHGLPASSRKLGLMWHEKLGRTQIDHDRGRESATGPWGSGCKLVHESLYPINSEGCDGFSSSPSPPVLQTLSPRNACSLERDETVCSIPWVHPYGHRKHSFG